MEQKKVIEVKGLKVVVLQKTLQFTVEGKEVVLDRKLGESDYRLVYNYLKLKNPDKEKGNFRVGNFSYNISEDGGVSITSKNYNFPNAFKVDLESIGTSKHQIIRTKVMTYLISNLE